jgi:hypothetical protein
MRNGGTGDAGGGAVEEAVFLAALRLWGAMTASSMRGRGLGQAQSQIRRRRHRRRLSPGLQRPAGTCGVPGFLPAVCTLFGALRHAGEAVVPGWMGR